MKWISLEDERPQCCEDILFTDGEQVYMGWLETYEPLEELSFYNTLRDGDIFPEDVTHWMPIPKPPRST